MHFFTWKGVTLCLTTIWIYSVTCDFPNDDWHYDVYTGRHFNELVTSPGSDVIMKPAILILYGPECVVEAIQLKDRARPWGPPDKYMTMAFHDYVLYRKRVWYEVDQTDNLQDRYMISDLDDACIAVLSFPLGSRLSTKPIRFNLQSDFYQWLWKQVLVQVEVQSELLFKVKLRLEGQGDPSHLAELERYGSVKASVHISMGITVYSDTDHGYQNILYYHAVEPYSPLQPVLLTTKLLIDFRQTRSSNWLNEWRDRLDEESADVFGEQMYIASRYRAILHQPLTGQRYSENGYKKVMLPEAIFTQIRDYYHSYTETMQNQDFEEMNDNPPATADGSQGTELVLPEDVEQSLLAYVTEILREWCDCDLVSMEPTTGISQYHTGSYISSHVNTEYLVTALVQIEEDHGSDAYYWPVEVIDFHGKRQDLDLSDGEVLLYEAGSVVFARPSPYQGELYTCLYVDFIQVTDYVDENSDMLNEQVDRIDADLDDAENRLYNPGHLKDEF